MKKIYIKIYSNAGVYKSLFYDFVIQSFNWSINGGLGDLDVVLARRFDNYGDIVLGDEIKVYIADKEQPNGLQIYSGEINQINAVVSDSEGVEIRASGFSFQLSVDILQSGKTVYFNWASHDPSQIIKEIIDTYRTNSSNDRINYSATSIALTGKSEGLDLYLSSPLEAINLAKDLADYDWFWYIDYTNTIYFKEISTTPTHYFVFGKDVASINFSNSTRDLKNNLLFSNGLTSDDAEYIFSRYQDTTSEALYGRRFDVKRDDRFKRGTGSADEYGARFLNTFKNPINTVSMRIIDSNQAGGYDIESIKVGDTCKVLNINTNSALGSNMLITNITYSIDYVDLEIVDVTQYVNRLIYEQKQEMRNYAFSDNLPTAYD